VGERLKVRTHYTDDEANTEVKTALMVKVGGSAGGESHGIHWHVDPNHTIRYLSDESREQIYDIELTDKNAGTTKVFKAAEPAPAGSVWRTMDCVDCHNRPAHNYRSPQYEIDMALAEGRIDKTLPTSSAKACESSRRRNIRRTRKRARASRPQSRRSTRRTIPTAPIHLQSSGRQGARRRVLLEQLPANEGHLELYPNHIGHKDSPGCFRCHDNKHKTTDGEKVGKKCGTCHNIVAEEESDSKLLQELGLQEAPPEQAAAEEGAATEAAATPAT